MSDPTHSGSHFLDGSLRSQDQFQSGGSDGSAIPPADYIVPIQRYDELCSGGVIRDHYRKLIHGDAALRGAANWDVAIRDAAKGEAAESTRYRKSTNIGTDLSNRQSDGLSESVSPLSVKWASSKRHLRENPTASTGQVARTDASRSWELDPIPFLIKESEWNDLARGVEQRVRLLDLILQDVYGDQKLLAEGLLPPEIVYGTQSFLRPMRNAVPQAGFLSLYACQIARFPDGSWRVLADRTQGPSGCGLAIENRLAISRILDGDFRDMKVRRLAAFFGSFREYLNRAGDIHRKPYAANVLLSPGVASQTYFEDAYLARYLGYTLTEASDLTVRGGDVYLKTLSGLVNVDTILRRISDTNCDPLEINIHSSKGIPGLCNAIRDKQVFVANQLGSSWAESPALRALLPQLCRDLLQEDLLLQNSPLHWCGDSDTLNRVMEDLEKYSFRNAFTRHSSSDWSFHRSSEEDRLKFRRTLQERPWSMVAVEAPQPSYSPAWDGEAIVPMPTVLRLFASATPSGFEVMPGGIARVGDREDLLSESLVAGSMSKDVWVLSTQQVAQVTRLKSPPAITEMRRSVMDLPSRVAEHFFWLGRSTERTEGRARHARLCVSQLTGAVEPELFRFHWQVAYALCGYDGTLPMVQASDSLEQIESLRQTVLEFLYSPERPVSLANAMQGIRSNAEVIRDRLSFDAWELLSKIDLDYLIPWPDRRKKLGDAAVFLNQMTTYLSAFSGVASENMTRGPAWLFMELGRRIERAYDLIRLVQMLIVPGGRSMSPLLESMLEICDSSMTYRYRYLMNYEVAPTLDLLLFDPSNPRSICFQLVKIMEHLDGLMSAGKMDVSMMRRTVMDLRGLLRIYDADSLALESEQPGLLDPRRVHLEELLQHLTQSLNGLADFITQRFLTHTVSMRHLEDAANQ